MPNLKDYLLLSARLCETEQVLFAVQQSEWVICQEFTLGHFLKLYFCLQHRPRFASATEHIFQGKNV